MSTEPGGNDSATTRSAATDAAASQRLERQMRFILEADRLKGVLRQTALVDGSRRENSAEHSWHLTLMAVVLAEHAEEPVALERVLKMLVVHDVVEIDAGDTFLYDDTGHDDKQARERAAAERLFGLLPDDQAGELRALWDEFEARETPEARFAVAVDALQPMMHNVCNGGGTWRYPGVHREKVLARKRSIAAGSGTLWAYALRLVEGAVARGELAPQPEPEPGDD